MHANEPFRRSGRRQTKLWYEPTEHKKVGHGTCHEETGDVYRHITKSAQRRASIGRIVKQCGEFHATFERGVTGRSPTERPALPVPIFSTITSRRNRESACGAECNLARLLAAAATCLYVSSAALHCSPDCLIARTLSRCGLSQTV